MTKDFAASRRNSSIAWANLCNFLLFLTGTILGCLIAAVCPSRFSLGSCYLAVSADSFSRYALAFSASGKFLLLLLLLSNMRSGPLLIPPLFGLEGLLLGNLFSTAYFSLGVQGIIALGILICFRLVLILPYGFLLGAWSVSRSLEPPESDHVLSVILLTLLLLAAATLLEGSLAWHLSQIYYYFVVGV